MSKSVSSVFLLLVIVQALHSIEEYFGELWNVFPPAEWLTGLISNDRHIGFLVANIGIFVLGLICWYFLVKNNPIAKAAIWFWIVIELMNGIIHPAWSIMQKSYMPGVFTSLILFLVSVYLIKVIYDDKVRSSIS